MSKKAIFYMMIILIMGVMLFAMPIRTYATDLNDLIGNDDGYENLQSNTNTNTNTNLGTNNTNTNTNTNTNENTNTITENDKKEEYNEAGLVEDTMMVLAVAILGITSIYAYKKVNEYKNI